MPKILDNGTHLALATVGAVTLVGWLNQGSGRREESYGFMEEDIRVGGPNRHGSRATKQDLVAEIIKLEPRRSRWRLPKERKKLMRLPKSQLVAIKDEMQTRIKNPSWRRRRRFTGEWNRPTRDYKDFVKQNLPKFVSRGMTGEEAMVAVGNAWRREV